MKEGWVSGYNIIYFECAISMSYHGPAFGINADHVFNLRKMLFQQRSKGGRSNRNMHITSLPCCMLRYPYYTICIFIEPVITPFIFHVRTISQLAARLTARPNTLIKA